MTTTAPRTNRRRQLRGRMLVRLAERVTTPLVPADYLDVIDPLRSGAAPARPHRRRSIPRPATR